MDSESLWAQALTDLSSSDADNFSLLTVQTRDPRELLVDVLSAAETKKNECLKKPWTLKLGGKTIVLRDVMDKLVLWVQKFIVQTASSAIYLSRSSLFLTNFRLSAMSPSSLTPYTRHFPGLLCASYFNQHSITLRVLGRSSYHWNVLPICS